MNKNKEKTTGKKPQWNLRSVDVEAVNAANMCAKKEQKGLGEWVSEVILKAAQERLTKKTEVIKPEDVRDVLKEFMGQMEKQLGDIREDFKKVNEPWHKRVFRRKDK